MLKSAPKCPKLISEIRLNSIKNWCVPNNVIERPVHPDFITQPLKHFSQDVTENDPLSREKRYEHWQSIKTY
jgi:hypothetical protein